MQINQPNFNQATFEGRKVPRYLYHMTSVDKFNEISKSGYLKAMPDSMTDGKVNGIFTFNLQNFVKNWDKDSKMPLGKLIMDYVARGKEIVMLRIPTKNLSVDGKNNIKTRDVKNLIDWKFESYRPGAKIPDSMLGESLNEGFHKIRKGKAIEYIIPEDVALSDIQELGRGKYNSRVSLKENLKSFLDGYSESQSLR